MNNKLERKYGLFTAICMVVGIVIGSGVFFKAQTILQITNGDMPLGVIAWLIGGAIMLACILTFAGMSQKYEKVNGIVDYAEATVGPKYGYYMGWFLSTIYYPSLTAALAWLSARYTLVFLTTMFPNMPLLIHINEGARRHGDRRRHCRSRLGSADGELCRPSPRRCGQQGQHPLRSRLRNLLCL